MSCCQGDLASETHPPFGGMGRPESPSFGRRAAYENWICQENATGSPLGLAREETARAAVSVHRLSFLTSVAE